jgi:hypothetical protein
MEKIYRRICTVYTIANTELRAGKASFQELMQIQIEEWTHVRSGVVDPEDFSESLL